MNRMIAPSTQMPVPKSNIKAIFTTVLLIILVWISAKQSGFSLVALATGFPEMQKLLSELWPPNWAYTTNIIEPMLETIRMAVIGTTFGAILSVPLAILCARNVFSNSWVTGPFRFILNILRTIPDLLLASIFVAVFGIGSLPGIFALTIFSIGIIAKLMYESLEAIDPGPLEAMTAVGANKWKLIAYGVIPQAIAPFLSFVLYTFEVNVRAAAVLGLVGAGGIGLYYERTLGFFEYSKTSTIIVMTLIVVLLIDYISSKLREKFI